MAVPLAGKHSPTRFTNGLNNCDVKHGAGYNYILPDYTATVHEYYNDFDTYAAADWTVTKTSAAATQALANGDGGWLLLTNPANNNFISVMQLAVKSFYLAAGKKAWYTKRFKLSDALNTGAIGGFISANTTPFSAISDGVYFLKAAGARTFQFTVVASSTATTVTGYSSLADDTMVSVGFYFNGKDKIRFYINGIQVATLASTNLPSAALAPLFAIKSGTTAGKTASLDFILASKER